MATRNGNGFDLDQAKQVMLFTGKILLPFAFLGAVAQASSQSHLFVDNVASEPSFNPTMPMNLAAIASEESFTALSHPRFPQHAVRIKKSTFCDPTVSSVYVNHMSFLDTHCNQCLYRLLGRGPGCQTLVLLLL